MIPSAAVSYSEFNPPGLNDWHQNLAGRWPLNPQLTEVCNVSLQLRSSDLAAKQRQRTHSYRDSTFPIGYRGLIMKNTPSLVALLGGGLVLWAIACFALHGPVILAYIAIQVATSGIFALEMRRIEKSIPKRTAATVKSGSTTRAA